MKDERTRQFLKELTALSRKYHIAISGENCQCGSPFLHNFGYGDEDREYQVDDDGNYLKLRSVGQIN